MPKLLAIFASPRGQYSASTKLTKAFIESWQAAHADGTVTTRDLYQTELPFVDAPWIAGAFTPAEKHSPEIARAIKVSDDLIAELKATDHLVIGTPMYNFSLPAILKAWVDHVVRVGVTVSSSYEGLVTGKKATVIIASGGVYAPGSHMEGYNAETSYLKQILGFIGITDVSFVMAGGTSDVAHGKMSEEEYLGKYQPQAEAAAV